MIQGGPTDTITLQMEVSEPNAAGGPPYKSLTQKHVFKGSGRQDFLRKGTDNPMRVRSGWGYRLVSQPGLPDVPKHCDVRLSAAVFRGRVPLHSKL